MQAQSIALIENYYAAFNRGEWAGMLALLDDRVVHDINQGGCEQGRARFAEFLVQRARCHRERVEDVVAMASADGSRAAAEFTVHGTYLADAAGLPKARGQRYVLPAGAFFAIRDGRIARVGECRNLEDWKRQLGA